MDEEFSKDNKKILMLYGPPGTGKSTMARVLARQCGYETQEVNASDVRTGTQLVEKIKNSLSTNAHFNKEGYSREQSKKPVCLILDEIDGALGGGADSNDGQMAGLKQVADFLQKSIKEMEGSRK